jgi:carboxylesterase type B
MYGWGHEFGPEILMDRDIIWVTINYRLGAFGKLYKYAIYHKIKIYLHKKKTFMS